MASKFILKKAKTGVMFNLVATNGQVILTSETYSARSGALKGIESVRKNAVEESAFERREGKAGSLAFVMLAKNKKIIGRSESYETKAAVTAGIASVRKNAPVAVLDDQTAVA